jgi:Tol biopolymer transport system component
MGMSKTSLLLASTALAVLLAVVVAFVGIEDSADAAFPGENGRIAYFVSSDFGTDAVGLHTIRPDGTQPKRVVASDLAFDPSWSADGTKIAHTDYDWGADSLEVFVANRDGSGQRQLTHTEEIAETSPNPAWSPDGKMLVFQRGSGCFNLYTMNADGSEQQPLIAKGGANCYDPDWSPDGQRIVFSRYNPDTNLSSLCTITPSGTDLDCFARQDLGIGTRILDPDFTPDGQKVLYHDGLRLKLTRVGGGVGETIHTVEGLISGLSVSPNGRKVVFAYNASSGGPTQIYKMNLDGTRKTPLTVGRDPDWGPRTTTTSAP